MKFGVVSMLRDSVDDFVVEVQAAERFGMDLVGVGDSPSGFRELYVSLAVAAMKTERITLGPMVTNPVTRHLSVTTSAVGTIDRLSDGRAVVGIGTGGSAVWTINRPPARIAELEAYVRAMQGLMSSGTARFGDSEVSVRGLARPVPVFVSAEGPRALALAGAVADGVILHSGTSTEAVSWCLQHLRRGAEQAGRDVGCVEVWMMLKASVAGSRADAIDEIRDGLAGSAAHAFRHGAVEKGVPSELLDPVTRLIKEYDSTQHAVADSSNSRLVDGLGLTDFLAGYFGLVGTPAECAKTVDGLSRLGVQGVICPATTRDPLDLITRLGREVMPLVERSA